MSWRDRAACTTRDPETFFPDLASHVYHDTVTLARKICKGCPVNGACRDDALDAERGLPRGDRHGILAGLTPAERYALDDTPRRARANTGLRPVGAIVDQDDPRHGSIAGYKAHQKTGVPMCTPCQDKQNAYQRDWRTRKEAVA